MHQVTPEIATAFERRLNLAKVPPAQHLTYHKWLNFYFLFCQKFGYSPGVPTSLGPFLTKLADKNRSLEDRRQAAAAVKLFLCPEPQARQPAPIPRPWATETAPNPGFEMSPPALAPHSSPSSWVQEYRDLEGAIRMRNYSNKTLEAYRFWVSKFQAFVRSRPTLQIGAREVRAFLSSLAVQHHVSASSQNQAFNSLLFFFRHVLGRDFGQMDGVVRAKRRRHIPVVLSRAEVEAVLAALEPPYRLVVLLLYGCGLRLIYLQTVPTSTLKQAKSPLDCLAFENSPTASHNNSR